MTIQHGGIRNEEKFDHLHSGCPFDCAVMYCIRGAANHWVTLADIKVVDLDFFEQRFAFKLRVQSW